MTLTALLPVIQKLSRVEKLQLMLFLMADLLMEEEATLRASGNGYPIWSPYDAFGIAELLLKQLALMQKDDEE